MSLNYNQFRCPLCGKSNSTRKYDPSDFEADIIGINKVGLGQGLGFGIDAEGSILESEEPVMVRLKARISTLYDLFYEGDEVEELLDEINLTLGANHETLMEAARDQHSRYLDFVEEEQDMVNHMVGNSQDTVQTQEIDDEDEWDEEESEVSEEPLDELDREILIGEYEEP